MSRGLDPSRARLRFRPRPMLKPLDEGGCVARLTAEHAEISAYHGDNSRPLLADRFRSTSKRCLSAAAQSVPAIGES